MKKYLLLTLTLLLCASLFSCAFNFNEELIFGDPEIPTADIDKPTEEQTQIPTEEPTEKPTEPIITIDGVTFDKSLKAKLNAAKTYAEVCEILGKEGTLVEHPEVVYYWNSALSKYPIMAKFKITEDGHIVSENIRVTMENIGYNYANIPEEILDQITIGMTFEEVCDICGSSVIYDHGLPIIYEWYFDENTSIDVEFGNSLPYDQSTLTKVNVIFWDYDHTKTITDINREKLQLGQSIAEINELFGKEGRPNAQGNAFMWDFEDNKTLLVHTYMDFSDSTAVSRYCGISYITTN